jgi:hypothetical protein
MPSSLHGSYYSFLEAASKIFASSYDISGITYIIWASGWLLPKKSLDSRNLLKADFALSISLNLTIALFLIQSIEISFISPNWLNCSLKFILIYSCSSKIKFFSVCYIFKFLIYIENFLLWI